MKRRLNSLLDSMKAPVTYFAHTVPEMPETKPRDIEQRNRVIAVEMRLIEQRLDLSKFSKPNQKLVTAWKKYM
ncbi:hypothetical protein [Paenibacillus sp. PAMC21692]|uniref:hypothetical protein n=1 Tax=Paenibacillus sp. PAMC21692 TaxID=2762320 RepID=UPI00164E8210|nr:hypothetical protein [Paenibacillus sp. PAMC21692]QNK60212.1 hypothetical protein H7F31_15905 [Paenibacillus sp. PAMC21692]